MTHLQTFVINLKERKDRMENILKEFSNRKEFVVQVAEAIKHKVGGVGLWKTIRHIVRDLADSASDFILICEDDHQFTDEYSSQHLFAAIAEAKEKKADILCGGVSWVQTIFRISNSLYWVDKFTGTQFIIIFKQLYPKILNSKFKEHDTADLKLCSLAKNKFVIFPFISIQKDFGYSDATKINNKKGRISQLFKESAQAFEILNSVTKYYQDAPRFNGSVKDLANLTVPTYVINLPERVERLKHIKRQFLDKPEFDVTIVDACKNKIGALGLWKSIRKVIQMAIANEDDVIVIVEDDHCFTRHYSKEYFLRNLLEAHYQNVDYLSGGASSFNHAIQVAPNRFWVHPCLSTQFIVVYKKFFVKILNEPFDKNIVADRKLSEMTSNKMTFFPFISVQKDFGYSDVTPIHNEIPNLVSNMFSNTQKRLRNIIDIRTQLTY